MIASVTTVLTNSFAGRLLPNRRAGKQTAMTLDVLNLHCENCIAAIRRALAKLNGIQDVKGDVEQRTITVVYREGEADPEGIRTAILEQGFQVASMSNDEKAA